jgi:hypothetical protein
MSERRVAPTIFCMPTSLIRFNAFAVDKFMKLMQAISNIKMAMIEKSFTYSILPPDGTPFS